MNPKLFCIARLIVEGAVDGQRAIPVAASRALVFLPGGEGDVKLRDLRKAMGIGVRELAALSGLSCGAISLIENDRRVPRAETREKLIARLARAAERQREEHLVN